VRLAATDSLWIIGVDPGKVTGLVLYHGCKIIEKASLSVDATPPWVARRLDAIEERDPNAKVFLGIERYNIGGNTVKMSRQPDALDVTGRLRNVARGRDNVAVRIFNASDAKALGSPKTLRRIGWWTPGHLHMSDAAAQALITLATVRPSEFELVIDV
jgi:hypothetical protein